MACRCSAGSPNVFSPEYNTYKKPSSSLCSSYMVLMSAAVGGKMSLMKMKIAFSLGNLILFLITYTNWPTDKSPGTKYFRLSISCMSEFSTFSQITGSRSPNLSMIREASAFLFSAVSLLPHTGGAPAQHCHRVQSAPNSG